MKISVRVTTRSSANKVVKNQDGTFSVWVSSAPVDGQANEAVIELLADFFGCARSRVAVLRGHTAKNKIIEII